MNHSMRSKRENSFDYMRAIAAIGVVIIHVCAMEWKNQDVYSNDWLVIHIYDMLAKCCVPLFFMISGRFFLDPKRMTTMKVLMRKIFRLIILFVFWSTMYMLLNIIRVVGHGESLRDNISWILVEFLSGEYHMWFIYAIIGLYLATPILRKIAEHKGLMEYFLALFVAFELILPAMMKLPKIGILFTNASTAMSFHVALGYSGYFLAGYYLYRYQLAGKKAAILYVVGILGAIATILMTLIVSRKTGIANEEFAAYLSLNVAVTAAAVYHFCLESFADKRLLKVFSIISSSSLGCYLAHPLFLWIFEWIRLTPARFVPVLSVPLISLLAVVLSILLTMLFKRVPVLRKMV